MSPPTQASYSSHNSHAAKRRSRGEHQGAAVKKGWQRMPLGEVCDIRNGSTPAKGNRTFWDGGTIPWFTIDDMREQGRSISHTRQKITELALNETSVKLLPKDSVLLCCTASVGEFAITRIPLTTNQQFNGLVVRNRKQLDPDFLFHYAATLKDELFGLSGKTTIDFIPISRLRDVTVPIPPLPEQHRIVAILDEAFEGIATAKANAEKNLKNARALFESHLQSVFTQRGEGWMEKTIGEVCILRSGTTLPKEIEKPLGEIPYLKVADMNISENLNGVTCSSRYVNKSDVNASNLLPVGTTIFPKRGGAILTNKKRLTERIICADLNIMGVTPKRGLLSEFLFNFFLRLDLREINNGSSIPQINNYSIEPLLIAFPRSTAEQKTIVAKLESLSEETQRLEAIYQQKLAALEALKKSLLHQAFTGQLTKDN